MQLPVMVKAHAMVLPGSSVLPESDSSPSCTNPWWLVQAVPTQSVCGVS